MVVASGLSEAYNVAYAEALAGLEGRNAEITIIEVDVFAPLEDVVAHPRDYRLQNVTDSCITPDVIFGAICRRAGSYLFCDFLHPTRRGHQLLSEEALDALDAQGHGHALRHAGRRGRHGLVR